MKKTYIIAIIMVVVAAFIARNAFAEGGIAPYANFSKAAKTGESVKLVGMLVKDKPMVFEPLKDTNKFSFFLEDQEGIEREVILLKGKPQDFEDVAMIPESSLSASLSRRVPPFALRQISRLYKFQAICILKSKSTPRTVLALIQVPAATAGGFPPGPPPPGTAMVVANVSGLKLDVLVNPVNKSSLAKLSDTEVSDMFEKYAAAMGAAPAQECEPTSEQLSAVNQLIVGGESPYVDFSIFGPYGRRFLKKLSISTSHFVPELGSWKTTEQPGPPEFQSW